MTTATGERTHSFYDQVVTTTGKDMVGLIMDALGSQYCSKDSHYQRQLEGVRALVAQNLQAGTSITSESAAFHVAHDVGCSAMCHAELFSSL